MYLFLFDSDAPIRYRFRKLGSNTNIQEVNINFVCAIFKHGIERTVCFKPFVFQTSVFFRRRRRYEQKYQRGKRRRPYVHFRNKSIMLLLMQYSSALVNVFYWRWNKEASKAKKRENIALTVQINYERNIKDTTLSFS